MIWRPDGRRYDGPSDRGSVRLALHLAADAWLDPQPDQQLDGPDRTGLVGIGIDFHPGPEEAATLISVRYLASAIAQPTMGKLSTFFGRRRVFESGLIILLRTRLLEVSVLVEQRGEAALAGTVLTLPLNHLLDTVVAEPAVTVTEIARRLGKGQQSISLAADRLERAGLIERRIGSGRSVALHPTDDRRTRSCEGVRRELQSEDAIRDAWGHEHFDRLPVLLQTARDALASRSRGPQDHDRPR